MGTRFTGNGGVHRVGYETINPLTAFLRRLRNLGATDDDLAQMREVWDDPEGWIIPRDTLIGLSDTDLRALLDNNEAEHYRHTHTPEQEEAERRAAMYAYARAEYAALLQPVRASEVPAW